MAMATATGGCFKGGELEDKEPPPGYPGGFCQAPAATCNPGLQCLNDSICYDPNEPCKGIFCGGNGVCALDMDTLTPICLCNPGYEDETYSHFCTPE
jgi:hypothetical protein